MNGRVIMAIARKDISDAIRNMYILFALVLPVGMSIILNFVMGGGPDGMDTLSIAYYAPDGSQIIQELRQNSFVHLEESHSLDALKETAGDKVVGGLYIPEGFDKAVHAGQQPDLYVYQNHRAGGGELAAFQRVVESQVWELSGQLIPATLHWEGVSPFRGAGDSITTENPGNQFVLSQYMLGLFLVMSLSMAGVFMVPYLLVEEKEKHTLDALLLSPAGPLEVIMGKAITGMFYSLIISVIILTLNQGWAGNWMVTATVVLLTALFVVGLGLFLGSLFSTIAQVNTWSSIIMLLLMVPTWIGVFRLPQVIDYVFRAIPTYYLSEALSFSLTGQTNLAQVGSSLAVLAASVVIVYGVVVWTLRQRATA